MSTKFRKYSANSDLIAHIKRAIQINVEKQEPINVTFLHGAYKLWRLEESPETDWAELFALMYYTQWLKPICEVYPPGVWMDFFVDDLIIPKLDNVPLSDIETYIESYQSVIDFLKPYQIQNFRMSITRVGDQFPSTKAFDTSLQKNLEKVLAESDGALPVLTDSQKAMVELNTKATEEQLRDPEWREKVYLLHNAYMYTKAESGYHKNRPEKILAFTQPLSSGTTISVGSTKDTIMKFWIGVGTLKPRGDSFRQIILSQNQLKQNVFSTEKLELPGLEGKNFHNIRVLQK